MTANSYTFYKNSNESGDTASAYISFVVFISKYAIYIVLQSSSVQLGYYSPKEEFFPVIFLNIKNILNTEKMRI